MSISDPTTYRKTMLGLVFMVLIIASSSLAISLASLFGVISSPTKRSTDVNQLMLNNITKTLNEIRQSK